jgi:hypothetical protein
MSTDSGLTVKVATTITGMKNSFGRLWGAGEVLSPYADAL